MRRTTTRRTCASTSSSTAARQAEASDRRRTQARAAAGTSANFSYNYDPSLACPNGTLKAVGNDGFTSTGFTTAGQTSVDPGPNVRACLDLEPAQSEGVPDVQPDPAPRERPRSRRRVARQPAPVDGDRPRRDEDGTGHQIDLNPPAGGGWPSGSYTATVVGTNAAGKSGTATATFTVKTDADNDGMPADVESQSCFATGDNDPLNAYSDYDGDGIPNSVDPQACTPATSYTAIADFNPDPLPIASSGQHGDGRHPHPGSQRGSGDRSSVRITAIADDDVSSDPTVPEHRVDGRERRRHGQVRPAEAGPVPGRTQHPQPHDFDHRRRKVGRATVDIPGDRHDLRPRVRRGGPREEGDRAPGAGARSRGTGGPRSGRRARPDGDTNGPACRDITNGQFNYTQTGTNTFNLNGQLLLGADGTNAHRVNS